MFNKFLESIRNFLSADSYSQRLESYLISKGVQSASDVDYWVRQYEKKGMAPWF